MIVLLSSFFRGSSGFFGFSSHSEDSSLDGDSSIGKIVQNALQNSLIFGSFYHDILKEDFDEIGRIRRKSLMRRTPKPPLGFHPLNPKRKKNRSERTQYKVVEQLYWFGIDIEM